MVLYKFQVNIGLIARVFYLIGCLFQLGQQFMNFFTRTGLHAFLVAYFKRPDRKILIISHKPSRLATAKRASLIRPI